MRLVQELFPRTIVMDAGLIVADGNTQDMLADEKFLNEHGLEKPRERQEDRWEYIASSGGVV